MREVIFRTSPGVDRLLTGDGGAERAVGRPIGDETASTTSGRSGTNTRKAKQITGNHKRKNIQCSKKEAKKNGTKLKDAEYGYHGSSARHTYAASIGCGPITECALVKSQTHTAAVPFHSAIHTRVTERSPSTLARATTFTFYVSYDNDFSPDDGCWPTFVESDSGQWSYTRVVLACTRASLSGCALLAEAPAKGLQPADTTLSRTKRVIQHLFAYQDHRRGSSKETTVHVLRAWNTMASRQSLTTFLQKHTGANR